MISPWGDAVRSRMRPRPRLTISQWADTYRMIPAGTSPESGPWRTSRAPYLKGIQDAISDPTIERIIVQAASQVGKTELLLNTIGYYAHQEPSPLLLVQPTEDAMRGFSKERVAPMFEASPALRGLLDESERSASNTVMLRQFPGGMLACAWAGSASSLASRPIRVVLCDELDRWPLEAGRDGDPFSQAVQRTSNFHNRKIIAVSTPTVEGSAIVRLYEDSDQRRFWVPCPHCRHSQVLSWGGIVFKNSAGEHDLDHVTYRCAGCGELIDERHKPQMVADGEWRADNLGHRHAGFAISALYSGWVRWRTIAEEFIKATSDRDRRRLQAVVNLRWGEVWLEESEKITVEALEKNRGEYEAEIPEGVLVLTAGVDVQDNRLEVEIVGWGLARESWGIEYIVVPGDTSLDETWYRLDVALQRVWKRIDGRPLGIVCTFVDSGGHRTQEVYKFCHERLARQVYASKGWAGQGRPIVGKPTTNNQKRVVLWPVGADTGKEAVYSRLALPNPGPGYCHWPLRSGYDDAYFKGLVSEKRVRKVVGGQTKVVWKKIYSRNEPLDIRVLATAAMESMNIDWEGLAAEEAKTRGTTAVPTPSKPAGRRMLSKGVKW